MCSRSTSRNTSRSWRSPIELTCTAKLPSPIAVNDAVASAMTSASSSGLDEPIASTPTW